MNIRAWKDVRTFRREIGDETATKQALKSRILVAMIVVVKDASSLCLFAISRF